MCVCGFYVYLRLGLGAEIKLRAAEREQQFEKCMRKRMQMPTVKERLTYRSSIIRGCFFFLRRAEFFNSARRDVEENLHICGYCSSSKLLYPLRILEDFSAWRDIVLLGYGLYLLRLCVFSLRFQYNDIVLT